MCILHCGLQCSCYDNGHAVVFVYYLQGRIDLRTLAGARMITECTSLLLAGIVALSMLGINISGLLLPAGVVLAIASRDLLQNFIAGGSAAQAL